MRNDQIVSPLSADLIPTETMEMTRRSPILPSFTALTIALVMTGCTAEAPKPDPTATSTDSTSAFGVTSTITDPASADPTSFTIRQAQTALAAGDVTSEKLVQLYLDRIDKYDAYYNAFISMNPTALQEARVVDRRRAAGENLGPLAGVPVVVKDSINMSGLPTTGGWGPLSSSAGGIDLIPENDAVVAQRLRAAGAIILGKTNLPVFAGSGSNANNSFDGPTFNVLDRQWAPGGSSTGTATAVAASFAVTGVAEETGGSIQNPASAQSLVGVKPTFALVPNSGGIPQAGSTRDVFGPIAKTVEDAAIMMDVLAGYSPEDPKSKAAIGNIPTGGYTSLLSETSLEGMRIGLFGSGWRTGGELTDETTDLYARAVKTLEAQGATVVEDPFKGSGFADLADASSGYDARGSEDHAYELDQYLRGLGDSAAVHSLAELEAATGTDLFGAGGPLNFYTERLPGLVAALKNPTAAPDMSEFAALRSEYLRIFNDVMAKNDLDALVFPQQLAPIGDVYEGGVRATTVAEINIAGLPGVALPGGQYSTGQPFSLIFVGSMWSEAELLGYAFDYASASPGRVINTELKETPGPALPAK